MADGIAITGQMIDMLKYKHICPYNI